MTIRVMPALPPRAMPDDLARLYVLEATIETLKAENEILSWLAVAEGRGARETAKAEGAIAELSAIMRLRVRAAALGDGGSGFPRTRVGRSDS
jgi:hypothetical protein